MQRKIKINRQWPDLFPGKEKVLLIVANQTVHNIVNLNEPSFKDHRYKVKRRQSKAKSECTNRPEESFSLLQNVQNEIYTYNERDHESGHHMSQNQTCIEEILNPAIADVLFDSLDL